MVATPRLANVQCSRLKFEDGDRILVRLYQPLDNDGKRKLYKTVKQWAGAEVEILIVDETKMQVIVQKNKPIQ